MFFSAITCEELKPVFTAIEIIYRILQIAVPILLVIMGSIDFVKAIFSSKENSLSKATSMFIKRLISALIFFLLTSIVMLVFSIFVEETDPNWQGCWNEVFPVENRNWIK